MESKDRPEQNQIEVEGDRRRDPEIPGPSEPEAAAGAVESEAPGGKAAASESEDSPPDDFDVSPSDLYAEERPDYISPKKSGPKNIMMAILAVLAIIALTWYAFRQEPGPEPEPAPTPSAREEPARPEVPAVGALPEKVPDAVDFSPTPETRAAAEVRPSSTPARKSSGQSSDKKAAPTSTGMKAAETRAVPAENKTAADQAGAPSAEAGKAAEAGAEEASVETGSAGSAAAGSQAEAAPAESKPAENQTEAVPAESPAAENAALAISDLWAVNISSTPDAAESLPLLTRLMAAELGGQVYAYKAPVEGVTRYRIRVGFFNTRSEAEAVGQKIKEDFKLSASPWVVKPTVEEVERYRKK
ncbi:MAG: SPOR domain-containing protein [Candidatus Adiutrix sp.]|nr:SPOR domain-containing protein [Candidatus Adiutrix sp.]